MQWNWSSNRKFSIKWRSGSDGFTIDFYKAFKEEVTAISSNYYKILKLMDSAMFFLWDCSIYKKDTLDSQLTKRIRNIPKYKSTLTNDQNINTFLSIYLLFIHLIWWRVKLNILSFDYYLEPLPVWGLEYSIFLLSLCWTLCLIAASSL